MIDERRICHESGHAVVALYFKLRVDEIRVRGSEPELSFDKSGATVRQLCTIFAAGVAAEKVAFGNYHRQSSEPDKGSIKLLGGGQLESYLAPATEIIRLNRVCFSELRMALNTKWEKAPYQWEVSNGRIDLLLLNEEEIKSLWEKHSASRLGGSSST